MRPAAVFDCNVLLQAFTRPAGPAGLSLRLVEQNRVTLFISKSILREFRLTLQYPEIRERYPELTGAVIREYCARLLFRGVLVRSIPPRLELSRDPDDEPYINLAGKVDADFLVTRDKDLLSLMSDYSLEAKQLRRHLPTLRILTPVDFLAEFAPPT
jgi:putative PIN family toxin of toxin-antitoxin system